MNKKNLTVEERLKIGEEAYNNPNITYLDLAIKYDITAQSVNNYALLYRKINKLPNIKRNIEKVVIEKVEEPKYVSQASKIIVEEINNYEPLTKNQQNYLLEYPNNYYFKKIDKTRKAALEKLANDNGYKIEITLTYPPIGNQNNSYGNSSKNPNLKSDGFIVHFEKVKNNAV